MRLSVVIAFCIIFACTAFADTVILKDGGKVVGKVKLTRTEVEVEIRPGMKVAFPKDKVKQIIFEKTPLQEFEERFEKLQDIDAAGFYNLGLWAKEKELKAEAQKCFEKTIEAMPDHTGARKELGHVRHEGKWLPHDEAMKLKGLVEHKGRWVTPEAKEKMEKEEQAAELKKEINSLISRISGTDKGASERATEKYLKIKDPLAVPALDKGATHRKPFIRFLTIKVYANFKPEHVTKPLARLAVADADDRVRVEAVRVLRKIKSTTAYVGMLKNFYYSSDGDVRIQAMEALGMLKDKNSVAPLIESVAYEVRRMATVPTGTPDTFIGTQSRKVIGYRKIIDSFGRVVDVPIIGTVTSGHASGGTVTKMINDIIFNLGARLALKEITGKDFNYDKKEWRKWWKDNKDKFGPYMESKKEKEEDSEDK